MKHALLSTLAAATLLAACTGSAPKKSTGRLSLDAANSTLSAVAMKNESVPVTLKFPGLSGWAQASGQAELDIPLGTLETGDPARDANIKSLFFEVAKSAAFGSATFKLTATDQPVGALADGQTLATRGEGRLSLHGSEISLAGPLNFARRGGALTVDLDEGWTLMIDRSSLLPQLKTLNENCPQPHRVGNTVLIKGTLVFSDKA
jgi:polyisoprenoid-binding protein YceI